MPTDTDLEASGASEVPADSPSVNGEAATLAGVTTEDHDKKTRGRKSIRDLPPVPLDDLGEDEEVLPEDYDSHELNLGKAPMPRDEAQQAIDTRVKSVHEAWVAAGKPGLHLTPRRRVVVAPEHAAMTRAMITRAGVLHKVKTIQDSKNLASGKVEITYGAIDRPPAPEKKSDS
jgi:hypothetical protein